jgi:hypothetical protein
MRCCAARGYEVNLKPVYGLHVEAADGAAQASAARSRPNQRLTVPNQEGAMDLIMDRLVTGQILSVVDAYTRECLTQEADAILGAGGAGA